MNKLHPNIKFDSSTFDSVKMGFCGIPPALVQRYAEEIQAKLSEVADILEDIRIRSLLESGKVCVRHKMLIFVIFFAFFMIYVNLDAVVVKDCSILFWFM